MKTTIDIPDALYKKVERRAVETGQTLKQIVLNSLEKELQESQRLREERASYWASRQLSPSFKHLMETGGLKPLAGSRSIDDIVAEVKGDVAL